jgi:hypothetical protein
MNPGSAPERIDQAHFSDQLAYFKRDLWSAEATSRLPSPEQSKTGSMPMDDGLWLNDRQSVQNARRKPIEGGEDQTIEIAESEPLRRISSQHIELVAQRQDLRFKRSS